MWYDMRAETFDALTKAVADMALKGKSPRGIVAAGTSMGGGISTLAFMDIIEYIRSSFGVRSSQPRDWAKDENLGFLIQHLTFAAVGAGDQGFYSVLNNMYERYGIRAWNFMHHDDLTRHVHHFTFRAWRGHRYILPDAVVRYCKTEFGPQNHSIAGYLKAAAWMTDNGTNQVNSAYSY